MHRESGHVMATFSTSSCVQLTDLGPCRKGSFGEAPHRDRDRWTILAGPKDGRSTRWAKVVSDVVTIGRAHTVDFEAVVCIGFPCDCTLLILRKDGAHLDDAPSAPPAEFRSGTSRRQAVRPRRSPAVVHTHIGPERHRLQTSRMPGARATLSTPGRMSRGAHRTVPDGGFGATVRTWRLVGSLPRWIPGSRWTDERAVPRLRFRPFHRGTARATTVQEPHNPPLRTVLVTPKPDHAGR